MPFTYVVNGYSDMSLSKGHLGSRGGGSIFIVILIFCDCKCTVVLPHGAEGWSAVCDCGIPDHTHLSF